MAIAEIKDAVPDADIHFIPLDLSSFESIRAAAAQFLALETELHVLLNNAGVMAIPYSLTRDGLEIQFGTCHVGHFLLTQLLLPALERATEHAPPGAVRIVNLSSIGHLMSLFGIDLDNIHEKLKSGNKWFRYSQAKLANMQHARALAKRYPKIVAVSAHPGLVDTGLFGPVNSSDWLVGAVIARILAHMGVQPKEGALNQLYCAASPQVTLEDSGEYFLPVGRAVGKVGWWWDWATPATRWGYDEAACDALWEWSEKAVAPI